jgi:hypothetical protein
MPRKPADPANASAEPAARAVRRQADDERFRKRFASLTGMRAHSADRDGLPREFLTRPVFAPDVLIQRYGRELGTRTCNALHHYEPGRKPAPWTYGRLLEIRGFGVFSLLDVLEVVRRHATRTLE